MSRYLITGAQGCIGAWVVKNLVDRGHEVHVYDVETEPKRLQWLLNPLQLKRVQFVQGDVCNGDHLEDALKRAQVTHVIHLAGLQVPSCKLNPRLGAMVNVIGTINVFEAVRKLGAQIQGLVYASSAAVFGPEEGYGDTPLDDGAPLLPETHYGVFKQCNEGNARIYFKDHKVSSIGLRPYAVYGPGRDFGITSGPTKAIKAAVVGRPFVIQFDGPVSMHFVDDTAKIFIACAESRRQGARAYNIRGAVVTVAEVIRTIEEVCPEAKGLITSKSTRLGIAANLAEQSLKEEIGDVPNTTLKAGVSSSLEIFRRLRELGQLDLSDLEN